MRLRILSDLHLEFSEWSPPPVECDAVILAGDIHIGANALPWIEKHFAGQTVIYVQGNHEGYKHDIAEVSRELEAYSKVEPPIVDFRYLNNEWTQLFERDGGHGLRPIWFFGGTLWTDFELMGHKERCMQTARYSMNDYRLVSCNGVRLTPQMTADMHADFLAQLNAGPPGEGKVVVVGHHLPSPKSIDNDYRSSDVNSAYASNLESFMDGPNAPVLWVHGHTHRSKDYVCDKTRVVANPRGYSASPIGFENMAFRGDLVVDV
jgi:predicted phosphodiesterase